MKRSRSGHASATGIDVYRRSFARIPGWFHKIDFLLFEAVDEIQSDRGPTGDILEVGAYHGQSAILLGFLTRPGERLVVCDTFPGPRRPDVKPSERHTFEANFLRFHRELPTILHGRSAEMLEEQPADTYRLVHIDGGHMYPNVRSDIAHAKRLLKSDGIVVLDDYRWWVTVAAAAWEEVFRGDLRPFCFSSGKMYATWGDPEPLAAEMTRWAERTNGVEHTAQVLFDVPIPEVRETRSRLRKRAIALASRLRNRLG